jgi:type 1 fimbria pilin
MQLNKIMLAIAVSAGLFTGLAQAASVTNGGGGTVTFKGSINDSPCSISSGSTNQTVDMGSISASSLSSGHEIPKDFAIELQGCDFGNPAVHNQVTVLFTGTGTGTGNELVALQNGTAAGAGIELRDGGTSGAAIKLGTATAAQTLTPGDNTLHYGAVLKKIAGAPAIIPGSFSSTVNFKMLYN